MKASEYINKNNITYHLDNLPTGVRGFVFHDDEGRQTVILNARLGFKMNRETSDHELVHIIRDDLSDLSYKEYE